MTSRITRPPARPAKDEWGVYDPEQAGLAALYARLDANNASANPAAKLAERKDAPAKPKQ